MSPLNQASKRDRKTKQWLWVVALALIAGAGVIAWYVMANQPPAAPAQQVTDTTAPLPKDEIPAPVDNPKSNPKPPVVGPEDTTIKASVGKLQQANGYVTVSGTVSGSTAGECTFKFTTPEDKPVVREVKAQDGTSGMVCGPIEIDEVEFSYLGDWKVTLSYVDANTNRSAKSTAKTIKIH